MTLQLEVGKRYEGMYRDSEGKEVYRDVTIILKCRKSGIFAGWYEESAETILAWFDKSGEQIGGETANGESDCQLLNEVGSIVETPITDEMTLKDITAAFSKRWYGGQPVQNPHPLYPAFEKYKGG